MAYNNQIKMQFIPGDGLLSYDYLYIACRQLNGAALKLFIFLTGKEPYTDFYYSPAEVVYDFGCSRSTLTRAFQELEEKGYLKRESENYYLFYESTTQNR